ncbi:DNA recombination protein RmuC [Uliginosibacterium sp. H1]|uniref:DNA recombination protein RmuC n=1 Tax=Uliginosibacterium sp. H1 TaxID=3114757 RepID=UPI002E18A9D0|nr:DNA recombination protein RmuC [Uliginosibacterium sp. H1]
MELSVVAVLGLVAVGLVWLIVLGLLAGRRAQAQAEALGRRVEELLAQGHRAMLSDLHAGLDRQGDRITAAQTDNAERLRALVGEELRATREGMAGLQLNLTRQQEALKTAMIGQTMEKLGEVSRADRELLQDGLRQASMQLGASVEVLTRTLNERLDTISGVVHERLDEGFKKTNETFASVMARLATIDEAQKKIGDLTTNVVSLQELLGDKRSRGAFGEVQLEALIRNVLPPDAFSFQYTLSNAARADCVLRLPEPTGMVAVDAKFPLENYHRMFDQGLAESDRKAAQGAFKADVRRHVDAIANKYIIAGETSDGAVMFLPAEAVFAEVHAYHADLVSHAQGKRVWIVSPTTLMAVLNTARAVLKDVETRKQIHLIKDALGKLSKDFSRFDDRMAALARHIEQAHKDVQDVHVSSRKISSHFTRIESVQLEDVPQALAAPDEPVS